MPLRPELPELALDATYGTQYAVVVFERQGDNITFLQGVILRGSFSMTQLRTYQRRMKNKQRRSIQAMLQFFNLKAGTDSWLYNWILEAYGGCDYVSEYDSLLLVLLLPENCGPDSVIVV